LLGVVSDPLHGSTLGGIRKVDATRIGSLTQAIPDATAIAHLAQAAQG
jgi:hypothetical protein